MPSDVSLASHCRDNRLIEMRFCRRLRGRLELDSGKTHGKIRKITHFIFVILVQISIRIARSLHSLHRVARGDEVGPRTRRLDRRRRFELGGEDSNFGEAEPFQPRDFFSRALVCRASTRVFSGRSFNYSKSPPAEAGGYLQDCRQPIMARSYAGCGYRRSTRPGPTGHRARPPGHHRRRSSAAWSSRSCSGQASST